jgi:hypothetical protein
MESNTARCLVMQMLEIQEAGWCRWKKSRGSKFEKTISFALLSQVEGLVLILSLSGTCCDKKSSF